MMINNKEENLINYLEEREEGEKSAKTVQYNGFDEVKQAWDKWIDDYSYAVMQIEEGTINDEWMEKNKFLVLFSCRTLEIKALRTYGEHFLEPYMFLFSTEWVPFFSHIPPKNEGELLVRINKIMEMMYSLKSRIEKAEKPVVLLDNAMKNDYLAFSIKENKLMLVFGFKEYSNKFRIADYNASSKEDIRDNDGYEIITFPDELIKELGLQLFPDRWRHITPGSEWEYREEKKHSGQDFGKYSNLYLLALKALNQLRTTPNDQSNLSCALERRVERFERLFEIDAPDIVKDKEARLLRMALTEFGEL